MEKRKFCKQSFPLFLSLSLSLSLLIKVRGKLMHCPALPALNHLTNLTILLWGSYNTYFRQLASKWTLVCSCVLIWLGSTADRRQGSFRQWQPARGVTHIHELNFSVTPKKFHYGFFGPLAMNWWELWKHFDKSFPWNKDVEMNALLAPSKALSP